MKKIVYPRLIFHMVVPLAVGFLGAIVTAPSISEWYALLDKPFFAPPNWLFAPVWTFLYIAMGAAAYIASERDASLKFYWIQLVLNGLWAPLFFGLRSPFIGLIDITLLWIAIAATITTFNKTSKVSAYLIVPYILWVTFAAALNAAIFLMNGQSANLY